MSRKTPFEMYEAEERASIKRLADEGLAALQPWPTLDEYEKRNQMRLTPTSDLIILVIGPVVSNAALLTLPEHPIHFVMAELTVYARDELNERLPTRGLL